MRWTEARQGVSVIKFRSVLDRSESTDLIHTNRLNS